MEWPPTLDDLKVDLKIDDDRDDVRLQQTLDAAIAFVKRVRPDLKFDVDPLCDDPMPDADFVLGTIRLAGRWHVRRRSPDGLIDAGDMGTSRIPGVDVDIARMLGIDRFRGPCFA
jgi:hypothetical protein